MRRLILMVAVGVLAAACTGESTDVETTTTSTTTTTTTTGAASGVVVAPVDLVPFNDYLYGVEGVAPEGWSPIEYGVLLRGESAVDATLLVQQAAAGATAAEVLSALVAQLELAGPPPVARR